jgi:hypothetical protein
MGSTIFQQPARLNLDAGMDRGDAASFSAASACQASPDRSSSFAPAFLLLKDLQRNRLADRLTRRIMRSGPYISGVYCGKNAGENAIAAASAAVVPAACRINSRSQNIFNGLLRVPVNEKIRALNSI